MSEHDKAAVDGITNAAVDELERLAFERGRLAGLEEACDVLRYNARMLATETDYSDRERKLAQLGYETSERHIRTAIEHPRDVLLVERAELERLRRFFASPSAATSREALAALDALLGAK